MKRLLFLTVLCMGIAMFLAGPVCAKVTGVCSNCHTMHNSQDGSHMILNETIDGTSGTSGSGTHGGGYPALTRGSCVGCHTGDVAAGPYPYVNSTSAPTTYLAGGNFYWVTLDDAKGHNVKGITGMTADADLSHAPGDTFGLGCTTGCHGTLFAPVVSGVPLATGCEGCHLNPKHHAPAQTAGDPALAANGYFRFLSGHMSGSTYGVEGIEDADWQYTVGATDHNEYLGEELSLTLAGGFTNILENTMTAYCTGCHGNFHIQRDGVTASANWIRHPSDAVLPTTGEYSAYTAYDPIAPVARPDLTTIGATETVVPGTDMVMCLSCHRAHGSPNDDLLRWDYSGMEAGGGGADGTGCFVCHTEKDD